MKKRHWFICCTICTLILLLGFSTIAQAASTQSKINALTTDANTYCQPFADRQTLGTPVQKILYGETAAYALQYPQTDHAALDESIRHAVRQICNSFAQQTHPADPSERIPNSVLYLSYESYRTENICSISFQETRVTEGSSITFSNWHTYLFDWESGAVLSSSDIFRDSYRQKAADAVILDLTEDPVYGRVLFGDYRTLLAPENGRFDTFALTDDAVIFYFDKYELLPGSYGALRLELSRDVFAGSFLTDEVPALPQETSAESAAPEEPNGPVSEENASETSTRVLSADKPMVALTYDDGPSPTATNAILDVLEEYAVVATFYDVGYRVAQYPEVVAREAALGCEVASHSYDHKDFCQLTAAQIREDVQKTAEAFAKAGVQPTAFRPPYGNTNATVQATIPLPIVTWSVDTMDWKTRNADSILQSIRAEGNLDGKVILMHGIYDATAEATEQLVPELLQQGYQLVTVSELISLRHGETPAAGKLYGYSYFQ